jgi:hypothetical protein
MHKSATKCNETLSKWCKNKHRVSKIMDTLETYQCTQIVWHGRVIRAEVEDIQFIGNKWLAVVLNIGRRSNAIER